MNLPITKNIFAIGAHPDDIEIGCGGTLAKMCNKGYSIYYLILTDGSAGGNNNRKIEAEKAASILNVKKIFWGNIKDTEIVISKDLITKIEVGINNIKPELIFVNYPEDTHQDHRHLAQITISATRYIKNVLFYETPTTTNFQPDLYVDIDMYLQMKLKLLNAHKSQINKTNIANLSIMDIATSNALFRGTKGKVKYAEAFKPLRLLLDV